MLIFLFLVHSMLWQVAPESGMLEVEVTGISGDQGQIGVILFDSKKGFPEDYEVAKDYKLVPVQGEMTKVELGPTPFGEYAVAVMHDENNNGKLDKNIMSMPKEGYGVSNNADSGVFGPPKFEDAVFSLTESRKSIRVKLRY